MAVPKGLALVLDLAGPSSTAAKAAAIGAASVPAILYNLRKAHHTARAEAIFSPYGRPVQKVKQAAPVSELKPVLSIYNPLSLLKVLVKHVGIQALICFNGYMAQYLEHEKQAIAAEEQGQQPPEPPPLPDLKPVMERGLYLFVRETLVSTMRRIYEHMAVARLSPQKSEAILRDSKQHIKTVLALQCKKDPVLARLSKYQYAILHSSALFYAADCTVSVGYHTWSTYKLPKNMDPWDKVMYWAKGSGMHVLRCTTTLLAVTFMSSVGSLIKPGAGTVVAQVGTDIAVGVLFNIWISALLDGR